jgi:AraC-like DNA-binding protein
MLSFINENVFNNITVVDVANAMNLSVRQTSRICKRLFACSINQLIIQARLRQICTLLTDTKYSIAEIAEIAGFVNPYSFSRHFSHYTGVTPSSYRKDYEMRR